MTRRRGRFTAGTSPPPGRGGLTPIAFHLSDLDRLLGALDAADRHALAGLLGRLAVSLED